jgi:hypothetical protein
VPGIVDDMENGVFAVLGGRRAAVWYAGFAVYAAGVALLSGPGLDHWWGAWAAGGYGLAALAVAAGRGRLGVVLALAGALVAPALWLITKEPVTPDAAVVARSGVLLLHHGTPYLPLSALPAGGWLAYNPYLPVMALFGLPGALGVPGGTRPWLIAVTFGLLYLTFRVPLTGDGGRRRAGALETAAFWLACPIMAFPLAMGITDPPVIALTCLSLALLARGARTFDGGAGGRERGPHMVAAALVLAVACAMKYTAWPTVAIIAVMVAVRDGTRTAVRFTVTVLAAAAGLVVALAPAALRHPASILENTVAYPLGLTTAKSPAQSPLPGYLLATLGSGGHLAALVLLAAAGLATAASLVIAPPATPASAARRIAIGLTALFALSPATRFGYFIYPIGLYAWAWLADRQADLDGWSVVALAERRRLDPVLAGGRAEPLAAVARGVDVHAVAPRRGAYAEPVVEFAAEHEGQPGSAAGRPAPDPGTLVGGMEVQVPGLAIVSFERGMGTRTGEHLVDPAGRAVHVPGGDGGESGPQAPGDRGELVGFGFGDLAPAAGRPQ